MTRDFFAGDTVKIRIYLKDKNGNPISVDGFEFVVTMKKRPTDPDEEAVVQKIINATDNPDDPQGFTEIVLEAYETRLIPAGEYFYDVQMKSDTGDVKTILYGRVRVKQDVTHRT